LAEHHLILKLIIMKRYFNKSTFLFAALAGGIFLLGSCLKNNKYYVDFSKGKPSVELPLSATNLNKPFGITWSPDTTTSYKIYINVASVNPLNTPVTATLDLEPDLITQYNASQDAAAKQAQADYLKDPSHHKTDPTYPYDWIPMEILPDSLYSLSIDGKSASIPFELTVPAKQREAYADLLMQTDKLPAGHNYVLPFTITKSSIDVSSWNHLGLWLLSSPFAGTYSHYHVKISGSATADFTDVMPLSTVDQHTVSQPGSIGDYFGGYTEYHFNGDGSISVKAGTSSSKPDAYGAKVLESSSDATTGEFHVKFTILSGAYTFDETFKR
jgi:hypothetical protein